MTELTFGTQAWLDHFRDRLTASAEFAAVTSHWQDDLLYIVDVDPQVGFDSPVSYYMKWNDGRLVEAQVLPPGTRRAKFTVSAKYSAWEEVHRTRMEAGVAFLTGKFNFEGPFLEAAANIAGEAMMLNLAFDVPTRFLAAPAAK